MKKPIYSVLLFLVFFSTFNTINSKLESDYSLNFDSTNWDFDSTNGVYYQIGVVYCTKPVDTTYQSMGIYIPKEYLSCTKSDNKYRCEINSSGKKGYFTAADAPIVFPVNTPGYSAMKAPTSYSYDSISKFLEKGIIYANPGCRGKYQGEETYPAGAPWAITDLKSAIRFLRYNQKLIPGDMNKIYSFGMSGGGAQSCLMGVTGNYELFKNYLNANGAAMEDSEGKELKDNIKGSQCWCPITNLDIADAAYEWNIGQYYSTDTRANGTFTKLLSNDLTKAYFNYVNAIKLKDPNTGKFLELTDINSGTYYDYLKSLIEESLNNFLLDTTFPYTPDERPGPGPGPGPFPISSTTYNNVTEYIDSLNSDYKWVNYDESSNTATITNVGDFIKHCKNARKSVGAFDDLQRKQAENYVFGISGQEPSKHFDNIMSNLLNENNDTYSDQSDYNKEYPTEYKSDLDFIDSLNIDIQTRVNMYNPMYYLIDYYGGYQKSDVADYFRINVGIKQSDTSNAVEMNLYLALKNYGKDAQLTSVWDKEHVEAERKGDSKTNFISWILEIEGVSEDTTDTSDSQHTSDEDTTDTSDSQHTSDSDKSSEVDSNSQLNKICYLVYLCTLILLL